MAQDDIQKLNIVTKNDLKDFATKEDLKSFATKDDLKELADLLINKFESLIDKLAQITAASTKDNNEVLAHHALRLENLE